MFSDAFSTKGKNVLSCLTIGYNIPRFSKYVITVCFRNCSLLTRLKLVGTLKNGKSLRQPELSSGLVSVLEMNTAFAI